jgi:hypothetical protein
MVCPCLELNLGGRVGVPHDEGGQQRHARDEDAPALDGLAEARHGHAAQGLVKRPHAHDLCREGQGNVERILYYILYINACLLKRKYSSSKQCSKLTAMCRVRIWQLVRFAVFSTYIRQGISGISISHRVKAGSKTCVQPVHIMHIIHG